MKRIVSLLMILMLCMGICMIPVYADDDAVFYKTRNDFYWGMNHHHQGYNCYPEEYLEERIRLVAKAGGTMIRINGGISEDMTYLDQQVGLCNKYGLKIIMTFIPDINLGLEYVEMSCKSLAERYNGKDGRGFVDYIQVGNETDVELIKAKWGTSAPSGKLMEDYYTVPVDGYADLPEYTEYFRAASKGIHEADSNTQFMINMSYKHYGTFLWYLKEGVEIDVFGWDWYCHYPDRAGAAEEFTEICNDFYKDVIKDTGIPVIICETNTYMKNIKDLDSSHKLENYDSLLGIFETAYRYDWIKGCVIYELLDEPNLGTSQEARYGMVDCELNGIIGDEKPIYWEIQRLWGGNENLPMLDRSEVDLKPYEKLKVDTTDDSQIGKEENEEDNTITDIPIIDIPETKPDTESNTVSDIVSDTETSVEKQETITIEPETTVKQMNVTQTSYKMPWLLIILSGVGMLLLASGVVTVFIIMDKKKAKKKSLLE